MTLHIEMFFTLDSKIPFLAHIIYEQHQSQISTSNYFNWRFDVYSEHDKVG